ncbi:unnamed protein product [Moneuplotes crassus]|uniref:Palmitoyltransferase n=1 Tax=Euplotes crassus TaxID=5936 RepID=A0AAD1XNJ1_EUPCR|nr:unnamed protein product [Moneuplotes crassus]
MWGKYIFISQKKYEIQILGPVALGMYIILFAIACMSVGTIYSAYWYEDIMIVIFEEVFAVFLSYILFKSYFDLIYTNPGIIPKGNTSVDKNLDYWMRIYYFKTKKETPFKTKLKYCRTCKIIRPPRSFHCNRCGVCIERHDHHCVFTGGCIGVRNHKKFVVFLFTTAFVSFSALWINAPIAYTSYPTAFDETAETLDIFMVSFFCCFIQFQTAFAMFLFGLLHIYFASQNITSNEGFRRVYKNSENPFKMSLLQNLSYFWNDFHRFPCHITMIQNPKYKQYHSKLLANYGRLYTEESKEENGEKLKDNDEKLQVTCLGKKDD